MARKYTFEVLVDRVLSGRCAVETVEGVEPFPTDFPIGDDVVSVVMHRDYPGAVVLFGEVDGAAVLAGVFASRLWSFLAIHRADLFSFSTANTPEAAIRFLFSCCADPAVFRAERARLRFVCGVEGAELLSELQRVARDSVVVM